MTRKRLGILFVILLFLLGCNNQDQERRKIIETLAARSKALNSRDISLYISTLSPHYSDKGKNFAQLKENLEKNFRDYEQLSYEASAPTITINGAGAESINSYRMKVLVRGKEMTLNGTEHLRLAKEQDGWKIIAGI